MSIDLIPHEYRVSLQKRRVTVQIATAFSVIALAMAGSAAALKLSTDRTKTAITHLRQADAMASQQRGQLESLKSNEQELERRWILLQGLRAGAAIEDIFQIIDQALVTGAIWFNEWSFQRAGVTLDGQERDAQTGYFVLVDSGTGTDGRDYDVETDMRIRGQARDHQALSQFVKSLYQQEGVVNVDLARTTQSSYGNGVVVNFDLSITLNSDKDIGK